MEHHNELLLHLKDQYHGSIYLEMHLVIPFRDNLLLQIYWQRCFTSWFICLLNCLKDLSVRRRSASSAKCMEQCIINLRRSLPYNRNSNDPRTEPYATPWVYKKFFSAAILYCYLSWRKDLIKLSVIPLTS